MSKPKGQASPIDENMVAKLLELGGFEHCEAIRRAKLVVEDLNWINFEKFALSCESFPLYDERTGKTISFPIPEYHFGETGFNINNAENSKTNKPEWFGGTGLDRGSLALLSHVSVAARQHISQYWRHSKKLRESLCNPRQHLSVVEEIWWLDQWYGIEGVKMNYQLKEDSKKDVDWSLLFFDGTLRVNLEVKRIIRDCMRHARGIDFFKGRFSEFCEEEVVQKFRNSRSNELNILAVSLFGEIDREVQLTVSDWLRSEQNLSLGEPLIDGIVLATREGRRHSQLDTQLYTEKSNIVKHLLKPFSKEDSCLTFVLKCPVSIPGLDLP
jgi:hypothetical protein